ETKSREQALAIVEGDDIEMQEAGTQSDQKTNSDEADSDDGSDRHEFESIHMSEVATDNNFDSQRALSEGFVDITKPRSHEAANDIDEADAVAEEDDIYDINIEDWEYVFLVA